MPLAKDLIGVHDEPEQAIRIGDTGPAVVLTANVSTQTGATPIGGPTGYTLIECNPTNVGVNSVIFMGTTELDREYTVYNINSTASVSTTSVSAFIMNVYPPVGGSFNGLTVNTPFQIGINKVAYVSRLGPMPPVISGSTGSLGVGTIAADRWIYVLSA